MRYRHMQWATVLGTGLFTVLTVGCKQEVDPAPEAAAPVAVETPTEAPAEQPAPAQGASPTAEQAARNTPPAASPIPDVAMPEVLLSETHAALCKVGVGEAMPEMTLPNLQGEPTSLASLLGEKLTVVFFFDGSRPMSRAQLADMGPDVAAPHAQQGVQVVGIAVGESIEAARQQASEAGADFPILVDQDGSAFAQVGRDRLPRTYLLGPNGNILWFDIEYSRSTRRQLDTALNFVLGEPTS